MHAVKLGRFSGTFLGQERLIALKNPHTTKDQADSPRLGVNFDFFSFLTKRFGRCIALFPSQTEIEKRRAAIL